MQYISTKCCYFKATIDRDHKIGQPLLYAWANSVEMTGDRTEVRENRIHVPLLSP